MTFICCCKRIIALNVDIGSTKQIVERSLAEVKLTEAARMRASSYSGGMKRRLSVAIALIGEPKLIILDEPVSISENYALRICPLDIKQNKSAYFFTFRQLAWIQ